MALTDNLKVYLKFDESSGNAADSSGNGYTFTNTGIAAFAAALINNGGDLGAANSAKCFYNANIALANNTDYTISINFKVATEPATNTYGFLFHQLFNGVIHGLEYADVAGVKKLRCVSYNGSATYNDYNVTLGTTGFHNITLRHHQAANTFDLVLDGKVVISGGAACSKTGGNYGTRTTLGATNTPNNFMSGMLDEVAIYTRSITDTEALVLRNGGYALAYPFTGKRYIDFVNAIARVNSVGTVSSLNAAFNASVGEYNTLVAHVRVTNASDVLTGVTFNGTAMTYVNKVQSADGWWQYKYILSNPDAGTYNITASVSSNSAITISAGMYCGTSQDNLVAGSNQVSETTTGAVDSTLSITTILDDCWLVTSVYCQLANPTAAVSGTERSEASFRDGILDSAGKYDAGAHTIGYHWAANDRHTMNALALNNYPYTTTPAAKTKGLGYYVKLTPTAKTKSLQYIVKASISKTKSLKYVIPNTPAAKTKSLVYTVLPASSPVTKGLVYKVSKSISTTTKGLIYHVTTTPTAIEKGLIYKVAETKTAITKSLAYVISIPHSAITKGLRYAIKIVPSIELTSVKFYLRKNGSPTGNIVAKLYEMTGTYGTNGKPTGSALATSDNVDIATLPTGNNLIEFTFTGVQQYSMLANKHYVIQCEYSGGNASNNLAVDGDSTPSYSGNKSYSFNTSTWTATDSQDVIFYIYGRLSGGEIVLVDSYNESNYSVSDVIYAGSIISVGESFTNLPQLTKTKSLKYVVQSPATAKTKALKYVVRISQTAKTKSLKYTIRTTTAAKTKVLKYSVKTEVSKTKSLEYYIQASTQVDIQKSLTYDVLKSNSITKGLNYFVDVTTPITKNLTYNVVNSTGLNKGLIYGLKTSTTLQKTIEYVINATYSVTKSLKYTLITTQSALTKGLEYIVENFALIQKSDKYTVITQQSKTKSLGYSVFLGEYSLTKGLEYYVRQEIQNTKGLVYEIMANVSNTKNLTYTVKIEGYNTKTNKYSIVNSIEVTKSLKYVLGAVISITKFLAYVISIGTSINKQLRYEIKIQTPAINKLLKYNVVLSNSKTKQIKYYIKEEKSVTKTLDYIVISLQSITKSLKYVLIGSASKTKSLSYRIVKTFSKTKSLQYKVHASKDITKSLEYVIKYQVSKTKSLQYVIRIYPYKKKISPYTVKVTPYKRLVNVY